MIDLKKIIDIFFSLIVSLCGNNLKGRQYLLKSLCKSVENHSDEFIAYSCKPKLSDMVITNNSLGLDVSERCAVILQGPIIKEDNLTIETARLYKNMYPNHEIIVSTWKGEDEDTLKKLRNNNIEVVLNETPNTTGLGNVNYQLISTIGGINRAKELGCSYILKTRTDQRIYMPDFLSYFLSLIELYPVISKTKEINKRIITVSGVVGATVFIPYMLSDFLFFGTSDDISKVFSFKEDTLNMTREKRTEFVESLFNKMTIQEFYKKTAPESRIISDFINRYTDIKVDDSVKSYWQFVKCYLVTLGIRDIDLYWRKYNIYEESEITKTYPRNDSIKKKDKYIWNFNRWLMLYSGRLIYREEFEEFKKDIIRK